MWKNISAHISRVTGEEFHGTDHRSVSGGSVNSAYALRDGDRSYFVKLNQAERVAMFEAETLGLRQMAATQTVRVPRPICWGMESTSSYIVLEWLDLGYGNNQSWQAMGRQLAAMHQVVSEQGFGWDQNNTIGFMPQNNTWTSQWVEFFREHRIGYQFQLAKRRSGHFPQQEQLLAAIPAILADHNPQPSLVHGDLWSGNAAVTQAGEPVLLDPAVYFGDREVDLAMTELFGGFPADFYQGYNDVFPLESGYKQRKILYNLYHILNHFNQFGGSYASQTNRMIEQLLAIVG